MSTGTSTGPDRPGTGVGATRSLLRRRVFAVLLLTHLFTQLTIFMNGLGSAWVLTGLTDSAALIAALHIAVTLPTFLLALIAGALADVVSRKRIILVTQTGAVVVTSAFALLSVWNSHTVVSVLGLTATLGILTAMAAPAWIAIIPGLVPRSELAAAMTLSSAGMSASMALGPAVAGIIIAGAGPTAVFTINAIGLAATFLALRAWEPEPEAALPAEHLASAVRLGVRYVRYDRPLKIVIAKVVPFALTATALMALLPSLARFRLEAGPALFGLLSGASGIGALIGLGVMPWLRRRAGPDRIVLGAMLSHAAPLAVLSATTSRLVALGVLVVVGAATLALVSTVMTALQVVLPAWIRGRGIAVYLVALQGSFALGALWWGAIAEQAGVRSALLAAGIVMAGAAILLTRLRLDRHMALDSRPARIIDQLASVTSMHDDDGPILLTARWQVDPRRREEFLAAMRAVRTTLRRKGALGFQLAEDVQRPGVVLESFTMATWAEYQRLPDRGTVADLAIQDALRDATGGGDLPGLTAHRLVAMRAALDSTEKILR